MEDAEKLRKVELSANESRGRSMSMILYDRSIRGSSGIGGVQPSTRGALRSMSYATMPSPSSVIPRVGTNDEAASVESILNILKSNRDSMRDDDISVGPTSVQADTNPSSKQPSNPAAPTLNNDKPSRHPLPPTDSTRSLKFNAYPKSHASEIRNYGEQYSVTKFNWEYLRLRPKDRNPNTDMHQPHRLHRNDNDSEGPPISTISIAFSPDGRSMASTHGDHSVKITCCHTGAFVRKLRGHPRTPWTVKYHPVRSNIVASGCLGFQVRVWDWNHQTHRMPGNSEDDQYNYHDREAVLLNMIRLDCAIISLSFHPTGSILAVASGQTLHLWNYDTGPQEDRSTQSNNGTEDTRRTRVKELTRKGRRTELRYDHNLRCVHFPPGGDTIIVGGANPPLPAAPTADGPGSRGGDNSYSLKLWDFDLEAALNPQLYLSQQDQYNRQQATSGIDQLPTHRRDTLSNSRTFLHRALLYNDGGFDVSPDGKLLCGCAEFFLPNGVKSAMEKIDDHDEKDKMGQERQVARKISCEKGDNDNTDTTDDPSEALREPIPSVEDDESHKPIINAASGENSRTSPTRERVAIDECKTPPNTMQAQIPTTPPSPPGRRWSLQLQRNCNNSSRQTRVKRNYSGSSRRIPVPNQNQGQTQNHAPPPPPLPPSRYRAMGGNSQAGGMLQNGAFPRGQFVPHVVIISLDVDGNLGELIEATPLGSKASSVTCVKFSPSAEFCLLGYGVRENAQPIVEHNYHPVSAVYRVSGGMKHIVTMLSEEDDVNIATFHPESGHGFVYGTKQGRVRVLSPWPWNYYYD